MNLVRMLCERGWNIRALVRGAAPTLDGLDVTLVRGDLLGPGLADAMAGADAVFHVAAVYSLWRRDRAEVLRANVDGTQAVLAAAHAARVPRVVHTSSVAAIGVRHDGSAADEEHQSPLAELIGTYKRSKYLAERAARLAFERGTDVVIVNPTTPIGPWDARPTPTGEIVVRFLTRRMPAYVECGLNLVDVRDVAAAHIAAYERGRAGERYIVGAENLTLRAILERLGRITGRPAPALRPCPPDPPAGLRGARRVRSRAGRHTHRCPLRRRTDGKRADVLHATRKWFRELGLAFSSGDHCLGRCGDLVPRIHGFI